VGGSKAKWFKEALGFTKDNSADLAKQIVFDPKKAIQTTKNAYGTKFSQIISVRGANGKIMGVEFIFIKNNDGVIRLVTSIPAKR
jgi:filamentous hemagglutinin